MSTEKQSLGGLSLEAQTEKIRAMAVVRDVDLTDVLVDDESADSLDRPGLQQLLARVDAGQVTTVIIAKLDRLTRTVADIGPLLTRLDRRGVALISVAETLNTHTASGRLVLHIMVSVSQWEREAIGERTRDVLQFKKARGERVGTLPFGAQLAADGQHRKKCSDTRCPGCLHLEAAPIEQRLIAHIQRLKATCHATREIADELNRAGERTRRGTAWTFQNVAHVLKTSAR